MNFDLTWAGNWLIDSSEYSAIFTSVASKINTTRKTDPWSRNTARVIGEYHGVPSECVHVGAGSTQLIDAIIRGIRPRAIVEVAPNYHLVATLARREGWSHRSILVRNAENMLPMLEGHLDDPQGMVVLSSPRNPLSYQFSRTHLRSLLELSKGYVLLDEVYADYAHQDALQLIHEFPNLLVVRSFSKAWGLAGLRVGFAVSKAFAAEKLTIPMLPNSVSSVAQQMVMHMLANPSIITDSIERTRAARDYMVAALNDLEGVHVWDSAANFVCVELNTADALGQTLGQAGYRVRLLHDLPGYPADWPKGMRVAVPPKEHAKCVVEIIQQHVHQVRA